MRTNPIRWYLDHLAGVTAVLATLFLLFGGAAHATLTKTPVDIRPADVSTLRAQLDADDTTLTLAPLRKWVNGVKTTGCFDTGSGFILIEDSLGRREYASFDGKSCSAAKVTTLSGLTRGLSPVTPSFSSGTGLAFDAGARVQVIDYTIVHNNTVFRDVLNALFGSGAVACRNTGQPCIFPGSWTTAQRDAFSFKENGAIIRNSTLGALQWWDGFSWLTLATDTGSFVNATTTGAGKVQLSTTGAILARSATGSTGAANVLTANQVTTDYRTDVNDYNLLALSGSGLIDPDLLPNLTVSKFNSGSGASTQRFWRGDSTWSKPIGRHFGAQLSTAGGDTASGTLSAVNFASSVTIPSADIATGTTLRVRASGFFFVDGATNGILLKFRLGSTEVAQNAGLVAAAGTAVSYRTWEIDLLVTVRSTGATGTMLATGFATFATANGTSVQHEMKTDFTNAPDPITVNTTADMVATIQASLEDATGDFITMQQFTITPDIR